MKPGLELDFLIAEKVMGWKKQNHDGRDCWYWPDGEYERRPQDFILDYSTDISAAWEVIKKLGRTGWNAFDIGRVEPNGKLVYCKFIIWKDKKYETYIARSESAPHAICLAALKVVEHND